MVSVNERIVFPAYKCSKILYNLPENITRENNSKKFDHVSICVIDSLLGKSMYT